MDTSLSQRLWRKFVAQQFARKPRVLTDREKRMRSIANREHKRTYYSIELYLLEDPSHAREIMEYQKQAARRHFAQFPISALTGQK